jgi:hypothetical protein
MLVMSKLAAVREDVWSGDGAVMRLPRLRAAVHISKWWCRLHCTCSDNWCKDTPEVGQRFRAYSIDLLSYGCRQTFGLKSIHLT